MVTDWPAAVSERAWGGRRAREHVCFPSKQPEYKGNIALTNVDVPNVRGRLLLAQVGQGGTTGLSTGEDGNEL
jgi:hypothetical protein